jgi:hypothetical protein
MTEDISRLQIRLSNLRQTEPEFGRQDYLLLDTSLLQICLKIRRLAGSLLFVPSA